MFQIRTFMIVELRLIMNLVSSNLVTTNKLNRIFFQNDLNNKKGIELRFYSRSSSARVAAGDGIPIIMGPPAP